MVGLPLLKLGGLAVKTLAKPVAKRMKSEATTRPALKQLYVNVGQWTHRATAWITISAAGHKSLGVKDLEEAAAFARGADFLSEAFVFFVGGAILTFEYTRSNMSAARKEAEKERNRQQFREDLETRFLALEARLEALEEKNAAGWARLFGGKEGQKDQLDAPHFADPTQVKQRRRRLSGGAAASGPQAAAGAAAPAATPGANGAAGQGPTVGAAAPAPASGTGGSGSAAPIPVPLVPGSGGSNHSSVAPAATAAGASGGPAMVIDLSIAQEEAAGAVPARRQGAWGRVLGWVGLGGRQQQPQQGGDAAEPPAVAPAVEAAVAAAAGEAGSKGPNVKAPSVVVIRRHPQGQRWEKTEEDRYWWRILFV